VEENTAIFSHFVAINAAAGAAVDDDGVLLFRPDNGSITIIETDGGTLTLIERGAEAATRVN
jgi:broad specificity phosphatase PhoE